MMHENSIRHRDFCYNRSIVPGFFNGTIISNGTTLVSNGGRLVPKGTVVPNGTSVFVDAYKSIWQYPDVLKGSMPDFLICLFSINVTTRIVLLFLKFGYLKQPRFVGELVAGIFMGQVMLKHLADKRSEEILTRYSARLMETVGALALTFSMFLTGLTTKFNSVRHATSRALYLGTVGVIVPFIVGCCIYYFLNFKGFDIGCLYWGAALSTTSFPVVTRIVADLKLIHTEFGQLAMSVANVSDVVSWGFIYLAIGLSVVKDDFSLLPLFSFVAFVLVCVYGVRPILRKILDQYEAEGYVYEEAHMQYVLLAVIVSGLFTDFIGFSSYPGALLLGLVIPNGEFTAEIVDRLGVVIDKILLPLYFLEIGLKCNFDLYRPNANGESLSVTTIYTSMCIACLVKVGSTILAGWWQRMTLKETLSLSVIMNTKGIIALVAITEGSHREVVNNVAFQCMVIAVGIMTAVVRPLLSFVYRPSRSWLQHKRRSLYCPKSFEEDDKELRILVCVHEMRSVPGLINVIELSNPQLESPLVVYLLHLVELVGNTATLLIVHNTVSKSSSSAQKRSQLSKLKRESQSDQLVHAFRDFEYNTPGKILLQPFTTVSPYATMDEDICGIALDKKASLIIIPYHKNLDGSITLKEENTLLKDLNDQVLQNAPCSVGILVDRGLAALPLLANLQGFPRRIVCVFVCGEDDQEALFYCLRMAAHPNVKLDIVRLVSTDDSELERRMDIEDESELGILDVIADYEKYKKQDMEFLNKFKDKIATRENVRYLEICSNNSEQTVEVLKQLEGNYDLFVVGRGKRVVAPATVGMVGWVENPELGLVGDALLSSELNATCSVLVVQKYWEQEVVTTGITIEQRVLQSKDADGFFKPPVIDDDDGGNPSLIAPNQYYYY